MWFSTLMPARSPRKPTTGKPPVSASPEVRRRLRRLTYYGSAFALAMIILNFLLIESEPWVWGKVAVLAVGTIIFIIWATRFSLWQRDEYWRERGRDPKHPDRFPERSDEN